MAFTKFAKAEVLDIKGSAERRTREASLAHLSDFHDYRTDDGYMYVRIRAISSRTNKNNDGWPTAELAGGSEAWEKMAGKRESGEGFTVEATKDSKYGFSTFLGKPIFVDHNNHDPSRARGVIVDSKFHVLDSKTSATDKYWSGSDSDPEHLPPSEVELLLEIDAKSFPKLAKAIAKGDLDGFSMGCDVEYSKCSHCGHKASSPDEYCSHIRMKGKNFTVESGDQRGRSRKSYENCYGVKFFEISAVFDPADETALTREVIDESPQKIAADIPQINNPDPAQVLQLAQEYERKGVDMSSALRLAEETLLRDMQVGEAGTPVITPRGDEYGVPRYDPHHIPVNDYIPLPGQGRDYAGGTPNEFAQRLHELKERNVANDPRWSSTKQPGSFLQAVAGVQKTAEPDLPQSMHTTAPEDVDTLRTERICPVCGSEMDASKCDVCGYESPPESLQNPDLTPRDEKPEEEVNELAEVAQEATEREEGSLLTKNPQFTSSIKNEMRSWTPKISADKPSGDEPSTETVISDQTTPVTSAFRTARELIAAAKRNPTGEQMSDQRVAAEPVPAAKPDKRVDVTGVGGVIQDNNVDASKPQGAHSWEPEGTTVDVTGKGGILEDSNEEASKPSAGTESNEATSENAGFDKGKNVLGEGTHTQTFPKGDQASPVTDKAFSSVEAAKQGVKPIGGPDVQPERRENLEQESGFTNPQDGTDQWTGTGGNGVTRQQDPVTRKSIQSGFISIAALKLADEEVELGITPKEKKLDRLIELGELSDEEIAAEQRVISRVRTAGLSKQAKSTTQATRVPSFRQARSDEDQHRIASAIDDDVLDSAIFGK